MDVVHRGIVEGFYSCEVECGGIRGAGGGLEETEIVASEVLDVGWYRCCEVCCCIRLSLMVVV